MIDEEMEEALLRELAKRARKKLASTGVFDPEEAIEAARWAILDLLMPHPSPPPPRSLQNPETFERLAQEIARRLTMKPGRP